MNLSNAQELLPNEVVALKTGGYINHPTNQVSEIQQIIQSRVSYEIATLISDDGLECEVLRLGAHKWKSGRLRLILLFEEDAEVEENSLPDNELDESLSELQRLADS